MAHLVACGLGIVGVAFTLLLDFHMQIYGRLMYGVAAGIASVVTPRFIEEYVPLEYCGTFITIFSVGQNFGLFTALVIFVVLPDDTNSEALSTNESWRAIFGLPLLIYSLQLLFLTTCIKYDSPKFHLQRG